jgi:hypothetical protein
VLLDDRRVSWQLTTLAVVALGALCATARSWWWCPVARSNARSPR